MKETLQTPIKLFIFFQLSFFSFSCIETPKVIVDKKIILNNIGLNKFKSEHIAVYHKDRVLTLMDSLYSQFNADTVYLFENNIVGFHFQLESSFVGYAKINYDSVFSLQSIDMYNLFDVNLEKRFKPSSSIYFFNEHDKYYLYDEYYKNLFEITNDSLNLLKRGYIKMPH